MKMTIRDKVLLAVVIFAFLFYASYQFIVTDQMTVLQAKGDELAVVLNQINGTETLPEIGLQLGEDIKSAKAEKAELEKSHFSLIEEQEEIILLVNEFLENPDLNSSVTFSQPVEEKIGNNTVSSMDINMNYSGSYPDLLNTLRTFWEFDRKILINQLSMAAGVGNNLKGSFQLTLYDITQVTGELDRLFMWFENVDSVKSNPMTYSSATIPDYERYTLIDFDIALQSQRYFVPFQDIDGHWAEESINIIKENGVFLPTGNPFFNPDGYISRGLFMIWLDRFFEWPNPEVAVDLTGFDDYETLGLYEGSIMKAVSRGYQRGFIVGHQDNTMRPLDPITYQEVEIIMRKVLNDESFDWIVYAQTIEEETGYNSLGMADTSLGMTHAEAAYLLNLLLSWVG